MSRNRFFFRSVCVLTFASILLALGNNHHLSREEEKVKFKKGDLLTTLAVTFVVGNAIAWASGAYPRSFDEIPFDESEREIADGYEELLAEYPDDPSILTDYGAFLSGYNFIEEASEKLAKAKGQPGEHRYVAQAWYASNRFKQIGKAVDLTMGIKKLLNLSSTEDLMNDAAEKDPENLMIRVVRLHTYAGSGSVIGTHGELCSEETLVNRPDSTEADRAVVAFALADYFSSNPSCNEASVNLELAKKYLALSGDDLDSDRLSAALADVIAERIEELSEEVS